MTFQALPALCRYTLLLSGGIAVIPSSSQRHTQPIPVSESEENPSLNANNPPPGYEEAMMLRPRFPTTDVSAVMNTALTSYTAQSNLHLTSRPLIHLAPPPSYEEAVQLLPPMTSSTQPSETQNQAVQQQQELGCCYRSVSNFLDNKGLLLIKILMSLFIFAIGFAAGCLYEKYKGDT